MPSSFNIDKTKKIEAFTPPIQKRAKKVHIAGDDMENMFSNIKNENKVLQNAKKEEVKQTNIVTEFEKRDPNQKTTRPYKQREVKSISKISIIPKMISPEVAVKLYYLEDYFYDTSNVNNNFSSIVNVLIDNHIESLSPNKSKFFKQSVESALERIPNNLDAKEMRKFITNKEFKKK